MKHRTFTVVSPVDGSNFAVVPYTSLDAAERSLQRARSAFDGWRRTPVAERIALVERFVAALGAQRESLAELVTRQMGRPRQQADEFGRVEAVAAELSRTAQLQLCDQPLAGSAGIRRALRREPKGVCLAICAWNYPLAMAGGMVIAALLAGNAVILKHSPQTPLIADAMVQAFAACGGPQDLFQTWHLSHPDVERLIAAGAFQSVQFIGSERGGRQLHRAAAGTLLSLGLELGGKDPAYVRHDADLDWAVADLIEGSFGNAGQSCCSVERIYVHSVVYDRFVERFVDAAAQLKFGDPYERPDVGPVVSAAAANRIAGEIDAALAAGARRALPRRKEGLDGQGAYLAPEVLLDVSQRMPIMQEETFGPVVPIMRVPDDDTALALMNDSRYGLTASVWSRDIELASALVGRVDAGTVYVNRCDHADLYLPWGGVKDSGVGRSYGQLAFDELTQPKAFHVRFAG